MNQKEIFDRREPGRDLSPSKPVTPDVAALTSVLYSSSVKAKQWADTHEHLIRGSFPDEADDMISTARMLAETSGMKYSHALQAVYNKRLEGETRHCDVCGEPLMFSSITTCASCVNELQS